MLLHEEILQQPDVLENGLRTNTGVTLDARRLLAQTGVHHVLIAARGTSDNAARYAKYVWGAKLGLPVTLAAPSLYTRYGRPPNLDGSAVVGISQSGQSPDLLAVLEEGRRRGRPTLSLTNDVDSPLADLSDVVVPLHAAPEHSIAATKSYSASLLAIAMIAEDHGPLNVIPAAVSGALAAEPAIVDAVEQMGSISKAVVLGRGFNHATAFEWAIKLQEMAYVLAHPYSTADFAHGPFALLERDFPVLAVIGDGKLTDDGLAILRRARDEADATISIMTNAKIDDLPTIDLPSIDEWISPLMFIAACQLFTLHCAVQNGVDPENPRGLAKVTKTA